MILLLKIKIIFFAKNHCEIQVSTILVCALYSIKYGSSNSSLLLSIPCIEWSQNNPFGATTISKMTFSKTTIGIKGLNVTLGISNTQHKPHSAWIITLCHYTECRSLFTIMINVIMLSIIMLSVIILSVNLYLPLCWMSLCWVLWRHPFYMIGFASG